MNKIKMLLRYMKRKLNKKGVTGTVIAIILVMISLAIIIMLLVLMAKSGSTKLTETSDLLGNLQRGNVV